PENWNSYGARPIRPEIVHVAAQLLRETVNHNTPQPAVVPTVGGGVQLEWHTGGIDLEIEIASPEQFLVYNADSKDETECELELSPSDLPRLAELITRLSRPIEVGSSADGTIRDER